MTPHGNNVNNIIVCHDILWFYILICNSLVFLQNRPFLAPLPKLQFQSVAENVEPKLILGSKMRKSSTAKDGVIGFPKKHFDSHLSELPGSPGGSPKLFGNRIRARTSSMESSATSEDDDSVPASEIGGKIVPETPKPNDSKPPFMTPAAPSVLQPSNRFLGALTTGKLRRDSAAVAIENVNIQKWSATNPISSHRKLSISLAQTLPQPRNSVSKMLLPSGGHLSTEGSTVTLENSLLSGESLAESSTVSIEESIQLKDSEISTSHEQHANKRDEHHREEPKPKIVVDCLVILPATEVIIGKSCYHDTLTSVAYIIFCCLSMSRCM